MLKFYLLSFKPFPFQKARFENLLYIHTEGAFGSIDDQIEKLSEIRGTGITGDQGGRKNMSSHCSNERKIVQKQF